MDLIDAINMVYGLFGFGLALVLVYLIREFKNIENPFETNEDEND